MRNELYRVALALARDCGGNPTQRVKLHQTLVFLGGVADDRLAQLTELAGSQRVSAFDLEFGVAGYWPHNRIVWAAPHATPEPLRALVRALEQVSRQAGLHFDAHTSKKDYAPHVTLIRNARAPSILPALAFTWRVRDFALVQSARAALGFEYRVMAHWPLDSQGSAPQPRA